VSIGLSGVFLTAGCGGKNETDLERSERSAPVEMPRLETLTERGEPAGLAEAQTVDLENWKLPDPEEEVFPSPWLRLFYSQDNRAELEACGCPGAPTGGMARRVEYVRRLRELQADVLVLEGPTALSRSILGFENITGRDRARADVVLRALALTRPEAFFPGQADFAAMPPRELGARARELKVPLVATNLAESAGGGFYRRSYRWSRGGKSVLLLGLVGSAGMQQREELATRDDAVRSAARAVQATTDEYGAPDLVLAFTDGGARDVRNWKAAGLQIDVLLTPPLAGDPRPHHWDDGWLTVRSDPLGRALRRLDLVLAEDRPGPQERGLSQTTARVASLEQQYLQELGTFRALEERADSGDDPRQASVGMDGELRVDPRTDPAALRSGLAGLKSLRKRALEAIPESALHRFAVSTWVMEPSVKEDPSVVTLLDSFGERRLARLALERGDVEQVPRDERFAGRATCTECHAGLDAHWTRTPHALAWKSLVDRGEEENPDCLPCHTTGFALPGGFVDPNEDRSLLNVQCEACHGPMLVHSQQNARGRLRRDSGLTVTEGTCRRCHDAANSPRFNFETYSSRVAHPQSR